MPLQATSGAASYDAFGGGVAAVPNYIEEVFSTYLWTGNGTTQTITNDIDLSGKGGMVWRKQRDASANHFIADTVRGTYSTLSSNTTSAASGSSYIDFLSDGFQAVNSGSSNPSGSLQVGWTFRKQPKFFDVVTWTGDGAASKTISHNLGSTPGFIVVKTTSGSSSQWFCWHRNYTGPGLYLNSASVFPADAQIIGPTPTSTSFVVNDAGYNMNATGFTYVAYLFAHDAGGFGLTGTDNVISCGSFNPTSNGSVDLGYEPQWIIAKKATGTSGAWFMWDSMRGWPAGRTVSGQVLRANGDNVEAETNGIAPTATGFDYAALGDTWIYITIRRGPMKVPTTGTSVFYPQTVSQADTIDSSNVPFPPDLVNTFGRNGTDRITLQFQFVDRLRGLGVPNNTYNSSGPDIVSASTAAENSGLGYVQLKANSQDITRGGGWNSSLYGNFIYYFMRRAPGFFDVCCYTGTGVARTVAHNLAEVPELMIVKNRSSAALWLVYSSATGPDYYSVLNTTAARAQDTAVWNNTAPTASVFSLGNSWIEANQSGQTYVNYLFATCPGVSKVGSYTGTGTTQTINCGFTAGARFVLIKRTDATGDWYVWDSARGIVAGNDPYLLLNSTAAEVTSTDYIDTASTGFEISSTAPAAINASGGTFIFLAIA
jgi:hypothetical protein